MRSPWIKSRELANRRFEFGPLGTRYVEMRKVRKAPIRNELRETRVAAHACGVAGKPAVERPKMTVLPVHEVVLAM